MDADEDDADPSRAQVLLWAYCTLMAMPQERLQDYKTLREQTARRSGLADGKSSFRARHYRPTKLASALAEQLPWLAMLVRTLDDDLAGAAYGWDAIEGEALKRLRPGGYPCYLVPVTRERRAREMLPAERRALLFHAVIPIEIGKNSITLLSHPDVEPNPDAARWRYGASVFPDHRIEITEIGTDEFRVTAAHSPRQNVTIAEQIDKAIAESCDVLMWPELTGPPAVQAEIVRLLRQRRCSEPPRLQLVVPGSWHIGTAPAVNRAVVLDGRGDRICDYDKRSKFASGLRAEAIAPGSVIPIIVTEDRLVTIGICFDFCNAADPIYRRLDCDVVLVPSMGDRKTTHEQQSAAKNVQSIHETVTFLAQQVPVIRGASRSPSEPRGYSFASPAHDTATPCPIEQNDPFRVLIARI